MNIKTITCHDVYNYGASLQAYALQTFLEKLGNHVEIIDYLPYYKPKRYNWLYVPEKSRLHKLSHIPIVNDICGLLCNRREWKYWKRYKRFKFFKRNYLHCTQQTYHNIDELNSFPPMADLYIAGSDQIWNTKYINGTDPAFYCAFVHDRNKCISYAASFATSNLDPAWSTFVKQQLSNFRNISVRELSGVKIAESLGYKATAVLDPVFLLSKEDWESLCKKRRKGKYLIVYDFLRNDPRIRETCQRIARDQGLSIYALNDGGTTDWADHNIYNAGPVEFLEWIHDANFVVSTSFHATAFSVIFEREFITFPLIGHSNSSRMSDFLGSLGLNDRFIIDNSFSTLKVIDYEKVNILKNDLQKESREWLMSQLRSF